MLSATQRNPTAITGHEVARTFLAIGDWSELTAALKRAGFAITLDREMRLATLLWRRVLIRRGEELPISEFLRLGAVTVPPVPGRVTLVSRFSKSHTYVVRARAGVVTSCWLPLRS